MHIYIYICVRVYIVGDAIEEDEDEWQVVNDNIKEYTQKPEVSRDYYQNEFFMIVSYETWTAVFTKGAYTHTHTYVCIHIHVSMHM